MTDEKKEVPDPKKEEPKDDNADGVQPETSPLVDGAIKAAERLEAANKRTEELVRRQEQILARRALGGESDAGTAPKKTQEQEIEEQAKQLVTKYYG